uniref:Conserved oligomeric Golgi complex subunit 1 n=1 Tax=Lepisosteus oculatus TaxID=7918 RepID=W5N408_LEPOC|nr:PREDICTED: conserved oligomeric Golgi complex subunit 1 isoform X1 [Lepisosteus oculatus]
MAAVPAHSLRISEIGDPTALFERYSADEIRGIERRVRGEIEQKKEELRQMVGERYRDLIEAADTIGEMRQCSESVVQSIQDMHRYCHQLKQGKNPSLPVSRLESQRQSQEKFYSMAAQIKLLLEIPERIWSAMESSQYLHATRLYLLCCHLHSLLQLGGGGPNYSPVLARFPILVRQVAAAGHFRSTILLESKSLLKGQVVSDQAIAEALVSTMLLEDSSPRQALADFLLARKASIQQLLNQPQHGAGIKAQVCSLVELMATTLYQAYAVFCTPPEGKPMEPPLSCGLLFATLETVTGTAPAGKEKKVLQGEMSSGSWFKYLPSSVTDFQPTLRTLAQPIQPEHLRDTLRQWMDTCKEDICSGISGLLVYVKSLKGLAAIRDAVWELLTSDAISQHWSVICQRLLERPLSFWEDFLQQLFLQRLQALTQEGMEEISSSSRILLTSSLRELEGQSGSGGPSRATQFEGDVASFLWSESPNDLLSDAAWVSVSGRSPLLKSGLSMKTQALTPCVQNFCSSLDSKLKIRLEDLLSYLPSEQTTKESAEPLPVASSSFDRFTDASTVEETVREHCLACVRNILSSVRSELKAVQDKLLSSGRAGNSCLSSVLFMARLCQSMSELCPSLKQCILGKQGGPDHMVKDTSRQGRKLGKGAKAPEISPAQARWADLREELLLCSMEAYRIWSSALTEALVQNFAGRLHSSSAGSILETATNWEELEIQEETESGSKVTSKIRLPVQPSWYVQTLLFHLCLEVNRIGGHALPKVTLQELLKGCLDRVITEYEKLALEKHNKDPAFLMTQNRALQLLFDLRYLSVTLSARQEEGKASRSHQDPRIQQVCDCLEGHIDPFDLDVFTPPLNTNLTRLVQRTSVLLGLLTGTEKQFSSRGPSVGTQEPYNILPLASSQIRFGLLPLSMSTSRKSSKPASRGSEISRTQVVPASSALPGETFRPGNLFRQLASQEEEPTGPSLFKLGWLSSMAK